MTNENYYCTNDVTRILGISHGELRQLHVRDRVPRPAKVGWARLYTAEDIARLREALERSKLPTVGEVARTLGVTPAEIYYAHLGGHVPEPAHHHGRRRAYSPEDIARLRRYLDSKRQRLSGGAARDAAGTPDSPHESKADSLAMS